MTNAAPSEVCDAFPAVTVPFCANTDLNLLSASTEPPFLGPSSVSTINFLSCLFSCYKSNQKVNNTQLLL